MIRKGRDGRSPSELEANWELAKEVFNEAIELEDSSAVSALLARRCGGNDDLVGELERMIDGYRAVTDEPVPSPPEALGGAAAESRADGDFGRYTLRELLGRGGMGEVYVAERNDDDVFQRVALKVLRSWPLSDEARRRFALERRVLASLEHPGIARLIDAGSGPDGTPFYAMELVDGRAIDEFCDDRELDLARRIHLFLRVCDAVQYAHANLIVHRDLKPGNILVDVDGRPRVVDFGIAKALRALPGLEQPDETREDLRLLTPHYAAPEQISGDPITIAADVYALGLLLYELLSGYRPFELGGLPLSRVEERILNEVPPAPSDRVVEAGRRDAETAATVARHRGQRSASELARRLRGDLDHILLRCLRKRPAERYPTVAALVADLERHLAHEPIEARPPGPLDRALRFVRRHPLALGSLAAVFLLTLSFLAVLWVQAGRLQEQRDQAVESRRRSELITRLLVETFERADPGVHLGREPTASDLAREAAVRIEAELDHHPDARAELLSTLASVHSGLGERERALELVRGAQEALEPEEAAVGSDRLLEASILRALDRRTEAAEVAEAAWLARRARYGEDDPRSALAVASWAWSLAGLGRDDEARPLLERAVQSLRRGGPGFRLELAEALRSLSVQDRRLGDPESAAIRLEEAASLIEASFPPEHPRVALLRMTRGNLAKKLEDPERAVGHYAAALAAYRQIYGPDHPRLAPVLYNLGITYRDDLGEPERAHALLSEAVAIGEARLAEDDWNLAIFRAELGDLLTTLGRPEEAIELLDESLRVFTSRAEATGMMEAHARAYLGRALTASCSLPEAIRALERAVPALEDRVPEDDRTLLRARSDLQRARRGTSCQGH